jgi:hypothetical protein
MMLAKNSLSELHCEYAPAWSHLLWEDGNLGEWWVIFESDWNGAYCLLLNGRLGLLCMVRVVFMDFLTKNVWLCIILTEPCRGQYMGLSMLVMY